MQKVSLTPSFPFSGISSSNPTCPRVDLACQEKVQGAASERCSKTDSTFPVPLEKTRRRA